MAISWLTVVAVVQIAVVQIAVVQIYGASAHVLIRCGAGAAAGFCSPTGCAFHRY
jgi:hypothetical protein